MDSNNKMEAKVLVISGNCFSTHENNGKTMANIFKNWPKEKLAQFYIWPEFPDSNVCERYYRITDLNSLQSILSNKNGCGGRVQIQQYQEDITKPQVFKSHWKNWQVSRFTRELVWLNKDRIIQGLIEWVDEFNPDVIFYVSGNSVFLSRITNDICKRYNIPLLIYCTDDYILPRFSLSLFSYINRLWLIKWMKKLLNTNKSELITINEFMKETYDAKFQKDSRILMNMIDVPLQCPDYPNNKRVIKIIYIGNLANKRWKIISDFAKLVSSSKYKDSFLIEIYSAVLPAANELKAISKPPVIAYKGSLSREEVLQKQIDADILLHVEAFDYRSRNNVKLSLSTKITEYMAAGKPILAIGPQDVASIRFLLKYGVPTCVTKLDMESVDSVLSDLLDFNVRKELGYKNWKKINEILLDMDKGLEQSIDELIEKK